MPNSRWRGWVGAGLALIVGVAIGLAWPFLRLPAPVPAADAVVAGVAPSSVSLSLRTDAGRYLDIAPASGEADTLLVLYPGGLVRPEAYSWLGVALAPRGVRTLIPEMPFDLAVAAPSRLDRLLQRLGDAPDRLVLAGHSLGGAMAARYALRGEAELDALVLMGAFSAAGDDLGALDLPVLVLAAERDGLATLDEVRGGMGRLPASATLTVIEGAVHSNFGRYGPQRGDGTPTATRAEAEAQIVFALVDLLERLR